MTAKLFVPGRRIPPRERRRNVAARAAEALVDLCVGDPGVGLDLGAFERELVLVGGKHGERQQGRGGDGETAHGTPSPGMEAIVFHSTCGPWIPASAVRPGLVSYRRAARVAARPASRSPAWPTRPTSPTWRCSAISRTSRSACATRKYEKFDIGKVLERLLLKGSIVVKKAYCDWERYKAFKAPMHEASFELIEIPHVRQSGKNSADIRMVVDALDLCYTKSHVDTFVIISGDSDFSPLVSKLRENDKLVIGVGVKNSTSDLLIANCDEFIYYDDLVREKQQAGGAQGAGEGAPRATASRPRRRAAPATPPAPAKKDDEERAPGGGRPDRRRRSRRSSPSAATTTRSGARWSSRRSSAASPASTSRTTASARSTACSRRRSAAAACSSSATRSPANYRVRLPASARLMRS